MALAVGDIVRVSLNFDLQNNVQYQNIFTYIFDGIGGVSDAAVVTEIATALGLAYNDLEAYTDPGVTSALSSVDQIEWDTDKWKVIANIGTFTMSFTPGGAGDPCPNQISPFVVFKSARPRSVGRKFLFPTMEIDQDGGILTGGTVTAIVAWTDDILDGVVIDIANELHLGIVRTTTNDFLTTPTGIVTNLVGTQRRRRPGYGA